mgnify:CR=1 FL=1
MKHKITHGIETGDRSELIEITSDSIENCIEAYMCVRDAVVFRVTQELEEITE